MTHKRRRRRSIQRERILRSKHAGRYTTMVWLNSLSPERQTALEETLKLFPGHRIFWATRRVWWFTPKSSRPLRLRRIGFANDEDLLLFRLSGFDDVIFRTYRLVSPDCE